MEVQVATAASLAEADSREVPLGNSPEEAPGVGSSATEAGAATEAPLTPKGAMRINLFDTQISVRENSLKMAKLHQQVDHLITRLEGLDFKTLCDIAAKEITK